MSTVIKRPNPPIRPKPDMLTFGILDLWPCEDGVSGTVRYRVIGEAGIELAEEETRFNANTSEAVLNAIRLDIRDKYVRFTLLDSVKSAVHAL